jgi:uncharacterized protein YdhG (YjbR/CyaY superfamily)
MRKSKAKTTAGTIEEYLAALSPDQQAALQKLRKAIHAAVPGVEECISYQLAAFRYKGKMLVAFGASPKHLAFYAMSTKTIPAHKALLKNYAASGGTIRFQPEKPLPATLVKKLVRARIAENAGPPGKSK